MSAAWKHPSTNPPVRGLYARDWRGTDVLPESDRAVMLDLWEPAPHCPVLKPGVWYVAPRWNDASRQRLPWREASAAELQAFAASYLRDFAEVLA